LQAIIHGAVKCEKLFSPSSKIDIFLSGKPRPEGRGVSLGCEDLSKKLRGKISSPLITSLNTVIYRIILQ